ncbi:uncharacterized protein LOC120465049 [Pimephales promelas]|uniref:uncharacterized protein LOC120465049 n=1 Tax=Pimephales promelas TaxID=90988 RepID=UPI001955BEFA|nr:uncharacterized protein LOC120465049 [Pimephales promelas]
MYIVDGRPTTTTMCYTSTTNTIPAVTNKTPGKKTETFTSTTATRIVTTIETSRPETETSTSDVRPVDCCYSLKDIKPPVENIVKYDMQDPSLCGIRAVRFYTKKNKVVCSDPESNYAKRAMDIVDGRKTTTPRYTSTTNTIPAVTTTKKTPGKKTETFTSTTATRIVTTIETSRPETETSTSDVRPVDCCYSLTDIKPPVVNIVKYDMQDPALCGIRAVRFYTKKNKVVCSDPKSNYAKRAMDIVDGRKTTTPRYTSTTNTIPAVTTTNKTPGKKTETFTSTTATRIVTTIETSRPEAETSTSDVRPPSCCFTVTDTRIPVENIVKYDMQDTALCGIRAVRFHTMKNIVICSDPESKYAKRAMDILDKKMTTTPTICYYTSTTNTIPAVTTTNKTPGKKTETSTNTTASRIVMTIETSRPETEASTVQDWVQDSIQRLNKRKTTEKTDQIDFDNTYFCLKKEQAEYFCIKQPRRKVIVESGELCWLKDLPQHRPFSPEERFRIRSEQQNKMKFTLFSAVLFSIGWMSVVAEGDPPSCCLSVTDTRIPFENIVKYDMQDPPLCRIRAVRFYTKKNKVVCSDPESKYAKRAMDIVDGRTTTTPTICYTSTTNTIPAVTIPNKRPGTKTETFTGDRPPPSCCFTVTNTKPPLEYLVKYDMQDPALCGIRAVRFYTKKNKVVCSDPESKYAKRAMYIVDGRTATTPTICYTSTTNTIPAVTTTNKTPGKNTETIKGNGGPESCCNFVTTTTIPVKSILKNHIKSRSKKGLRRFQAGVWQKQ